MSALLKVGIGVREITPSIGMPDMYGFGLTVKQITPPLLLKV